MRTVSTVSTVVTLAVLFGVQPLQAQEEITIGEGAQVYAATCSRCHNARSPSERSDREWGVIMLHMRTRGTLSGRETRAAMMFLQGTNGEEHPAASAANLSGRPTGGPNPVSAEEGGNLVERNGCMACHKIGRFTSGTLGPDLNTVLKRRTKEWILGKLANPKIDNPSTVMPQMNLSPADREAIVAYLESISK